MTNTDRKVVTRFAPSPTGFLHAGAYRTAIYSYLYARKHAGTFVLRIEDTDKERSKKEFEENIIDSLKWLGLEYDVFVRQSENMERHKAVLLKMIADGHAYISKEEAKDGSGVIKEIVRFKNPNIDVTFADEIKGSVTMNTTDLGDFVIAKNIEEPLFHLAVVVDDFDVGITHVIRGEDHVSNTPRQILIQRAIGAPTPMYAHLPLVLGADRKKLSKRRGALALTEYRERGYLPGAILNMVSLVGWNPGTDQEIFTREELESAFDLAKVQKSGALFNPEKLEWINKEHILRMDPSARLDAIESYITSDIKALSGYSRAMLEKIAPVVIERITNFGEVRTMCDEGELSYFFFAPTIPKEKLVWKGEGDVTTTTARLLHVRELLEPLPGGAEFTPENVKNALWSYAEAEGRGNVLWPLRYALSGRDKSPDPFQLSGILGKDEVMTRINNAVK
jgi:glutamyl-tRNA synthetase